MGSPLGVVGLFGGGGEAGADDAVALSPLNVDDGEHMGVGGEADDGKSLFGGGAGIEIDGMGVLECGGSFSSNDRRYAADSSVERTSPRSIAANASRTSSTSSGCGTKTGVGGTARLGLIDGPDIYARVRQ